jgi:hypothetical protein
LTVRRWADRRECHWAATTADCWVARWGECSAAWTVLRWVDRRERHWVVSRADWLVFRRVAKTGQMMVAGWELLWAAAWVGWTVGHSDWLTAASTDESSAVCWVAMLVAASGER